ncbi:MAG: hypothetical protein WKF57_01530 [Nakamurella sp.]
MANFFGTREFVRIDEDDTAADNHWLGRPCSQRFWPLRVGPAMGWTVGGTDKNCSLRDGDVVAGCSGRTAEARVVRRHDVATASAR